LPSSFCWSPAGCARWTRRATYGPSPWRGITIAVSPLLLILAANVYLDRYDLLLAHHTIFDGINYTDAHVMLTGLLIVSAALVVGALIAAANAVRRPRGIWLAGAIVPAVLCYVLLTVVAWYVSSFIVKPNELVREEPYITNNIQMTRQAYGLDRFTQREFPAETTVEATDLPTIRSRCRTFACGTGTRCRIRCARSRRFAPTTTSPTSTSIATASMAPCAR